MIAADGRYRRYLLIYVATFACVWALVGLSDEVRPGELIAAAVLQIVLAGLVWRARTRAVGFATFVVGTALLDVSLGLMRDASGQKPGVAVLMLIPAVIAAARASRPELAWALFAAAATVYVPELYPGGQQYPLSALRPATMMMIVGVVFSLVVLRLVEALHEVQERQRISILEAESKLVIEDALRQVATLVAAGAPPIELFSDISQHLAHIAGSSMAAVIRFDAERMVGTLLGGWRADGPITIGRQWDLHGETAAAEVFHTGATVTKIAYPDSPDIAGAVSAVSAPVFVSGRLWGAASAVFVAGDPVPVDLTERFERFAELVAVAIANAEAVSQLVEHATIDSLTGIPNRRSFDERVITELDRASRGGRDLAIVLLDIDDFKRVNDTYGHQKGDRVLAEVARVLRSEIRSGEMVARLGGEEFVWLMPDTTAEEAMVAAERARRAVAAIRFAGVGHITLSAGVNSSRSAATRTLLVEGADTALYMAKSAGRDQTVAASGSFSSAEERVKPAAA